MQLSSIKDQEVVLGVATTVVSLDVDNSKGIGLLLTAYRSSFVSVKPTESQFSGKIQSNDWLLNNIEMDWTKANYLLAKDILNFKIYWFQ